MRGQQGVNQEVFEIRTDEALGLRYVVHRPNIE